MKKEIVFISLFLLCLPFVLGAIISVPGNSSTIQGAINNAIAGDTILVGAGTYTENLVINKSVSIVGVSGVTIAGSHVVSASDIVLENIIFTTVGTTIILDSSLSEIKNITIQNSVFDLSNSPSVGIHLGGGSPTFKVWKITIKNNSFNGPVDKICNPWKIGGSFGSPLSVAVEQVDFITNVVNRCSIPINLYDKDITDVFIDDNVFRDTDGVLYVWHNLANPMGTLSQFVFINNDVDGSNTYGIGIDLNTSLVFDDDNFGTGNLIAYNRFVGIIGGYGFEGVSLLSPVINYTLNATYNYWGSCDGPSGAGLGSGSGVSANVDFIPFNGICFSNESGPVCAFEDQNATVMANVSGTAIESVWFSYTANGTAYNGTGLPFGTNMYRHSIDEHRLVNETIFWQAHAQDSFGNVFNGSIQPLYIREISQVSTAPASADGLNGWFVSEPTFSLSGDLNKSATYYRWDSLVAQVYSGPFGLEDIPNAPPIASAGTLDLHYWSAFSCGNESEQSRIFYVDLQDPVITDSSPQENETVYVSTPTIFAYLDEVFQSNSGINRSSVVVRVDGVGVPATIASASVINKSSLDAIVSYTPTINLSEGMHSVFISVSDNAGRVSNKTWNFFVNTSVGSFDLVVHAPTSGYYESRRVPFNITTSSEAVLLEYINYNNRNPRWRALCTDCSEYGFSKIRTNTQNEGENTITVRATNIFGTVRVANVSFLVDSRKPIISSILPARNKVTNGSDFYIRYSEDNLENISISWNPSVVLFGSATNNSIIALWHFDEGSGTNVFDETTHNNDGTINSAAWTSDSVSGQALEFDGVDDSIAITKTASVDLTTDVIIEAYVKRKSSNDGMILSKNGPYFLAIRNNVIVGGIYSNNGGWTESHGSTVLQQNVWYKLKMVYDGDTIKVYVNDVLENSTAKTGEMPQVSQSINIGWGELGHNQFFKGIIDEVKISSSEGLSNQCTQSGKNSECFFKLNLSVFDGDEITYQVTVADPVRAVSSRQATVLVDVTSPLLSVHLPANETYNRKVPFNISVSEKVSLLYYDASASNPAWRRLCVNCEEYGFYKNKTKQFDEGMHLVLIQAVDRAGNSAIERVSFFVN